MLGISHENTHAFLFASLAEIAKLLSEEILLRTDPARKRTNIMSNMKVLECPRISTIRQHFLPHTKIMEEPYLSYCCLILSLTLVFSRKWKDANHLSVLLREVVGFILFIKKSNNDEVAPVLN
jgi:hypothetical protein